MNTEKNEINVVLIQVKNFDSSQLMDYIERETCKERGIIPTFHFIPNFKTISSIVYRKFRSIVSILNTK